MYTSYLQIAMMVFFINKMIKCLQYLKKKTQKPVFEALQKIKQGPPSTDPIDSKYMRPTLLL